MAENSTQENENKAEYKQIATKLLELTKEYQQDLNKENPVESAINDMFNYLISNILNNDQFTDKKKIEEFYNYLAPKYAIKGEQNGNDQVKNTNHLNVIKQDNSIAARDYLAGIAVIAGLLATGVIPVAIIVGVVYAATGKDLTDIFDVFNTRSERYEKEIFKQRNTFFEQQPKEVTEKKDIKEKPQDTPSNDSPAPTSSPQS